MTDELTKLAAQRCADEMNEANCRNCWGAPEFWRNPTGSNALWRADKERAHHAAERAKAFILRNDPTGACVGHNRIIAALDALILTPPVDPVVEGLAEAWKQAMSVYHATHIDKGSQDRACITRLRDTLAKRGLELREGGGA